MAPEVPNPAHLNMAAAPERQTGADANEVMPTMEQGGEAGKGKSREI